MSALSHSRTAKSLDSSSRQRVEATPQREDSLPLFELLSFCRRFPGDISSLKHLVDALNEGQPSDVQSLKLHTLTIIQWFSNQNHSSLTEDLLVEYSLLGHVQPRNQEAEEILSSWFQSIISKLSSSEVQDGFIRLYIAALTSADPNIYREKLNDLLTLQNNLLSSLNQFKTKILDLETAPYFNLRLSAIYLTLIAISSIEKTMPTQDGPVGRFKDYLRIIKKKQKMAGLKYQACMMRVGLDRVSGGSSRGPFIKPTRTSDIVSVFRFLQMTEGVIDLVAVKTDDRGKPRAAKTPGFKKKWIKRVFCLGELRRQAQEDPSSYGDFAVTVDKYMSKNPFKTGHRVCQKLGILQNLQAIILTAEEAQTRARALRTLLGFAEHCLTKHTSGPNSEVIESVSRTLKYLLLNVSVSTGSALRESLRQVIGQWKTSDDFFDQQASKIADHATVSPSKLLFKIRESLGLPMSPSNRHSLEKELRKKYVFRFSDRKPEKSSYPDYVDYLDRGFDVVGGMEGLTEVLRLPALFQGTPDGEVEFIQGVLLTGDSTMIERCFSKRLIYLWSVGKIWMEYPSVYLLSAEDIKADDYDGSTEKTVGSLSTAIARRCFKSRRSVKEFMALRHYIREELEKPSTMVILDLIDCEAEDQISQEILQDLMSLEENHKLLVIARRPDLVADYDVIEREVEGRLREESEVMNSVKKEVGESEALALHRMMERTSSLLDFGKRPACLSSICSLWRKMKQDGQPSRYRLVEKLADLVWEECGGGSKAVSNREKVIDRLIAAALDEMVEGQLALDDQDSDLCLAEMAEDADFVFLEISADDYFFPWKFFQEYFAGLELAEMLCSDDPREVAEAKRILEAKKYEKSFQSAIQFATDRLIEISDEEKLVVVEWIFDLLDQSPVEVSGLHHFMMKLELLNNAAPLIGDWMVGKDEPPFIRAMMNAIESVDRDLAQDLSLSMFVSFLWYRTELVKLTELRSRFPEVFKSIEFEDTPIRRYLRTCLNEDPTQRVNAAWAAAPMIKMAPDSTDQIVEAVARLCRDPVREVQAEALANVPYLIEAAPDHSDILLIAFLDTVGGSGDRRGEPIVAPAVLSYLIRTVPDFEGSLRAVLDEIEWVGGLEEGSGELPSTIREAIMDWLDGGGYWPSMYLISRIQEISVTIAPAEDGRFVRMVVYSEFEVEEFEIARTVALDLSHSIFDIDLV